MGVKGTDWDLVLVPSSWWLTTICNSIFRESVALFWPPLVLHAQGAQKQMLHEIHLKRFLKQISKTKQGRCMFVDGFSRVVMGRWLGGRGSPIEAIGSQLEADEDT